MDKKVGSNSLIPIIKAGDKGGEYKDELKDIKDKNEEFNKQLKEKDSQGNTMLHIACKYGKLEKVNYLIQNSADIYKTITDKNGDDKTPLEIASDSNNPEIVKLILEESKRREQEINTSLENESLTILSTEAEIQDNLNKSHEKQSKIKTLDAKKDNAEITELEKEVKSLENDYTSKQQSLSKSKNKKITLQQESSTIRVKNLSVINSIAEHINSDKCPLTQKLAIISSCTEHIQVYKKKFPEQCLQDIYQKAAMSTEINTDQLIVLEELLEEKPDQKKLKNFIDHSTGENRAYFITKMASTLIQESKNGVYSENINIYLEVLTQENKMLEKHDISSAKEDILYEPNTKISNKENTENKIHKHTTGVINKGGMQDIAKQLSVNPGGFSAYILDVDKVTDNEFLSVTPDDKLNVLDFIVSKTDDLDIVKSTVKRLKQNKKGNISFGKGFDIAGHNGSILNNAVKYGNDALIEQLMLESSIKLATTRPSSHNYDAHNTPLHTALLYGRDVTFNTMLQRSEESDITKALITKNYDKYNVMDIIVLQNKLSAMLQVLNTITKPANFELAINAMKENSTISKIAEKGNIEILKAILNKQDVINSKNSDKHIDIREHKKTFNIEGQDLQLDVFGELAYHGHFDKLEQLIDEGYCKLEDYSIDDLKNLSFVVKHTNNYTSSLSEKITEEIGKKQKSVKGTKEIPEDEIENIANAIMYGNETIKKEAYKKVKDNQEKMSDTVYKLTEHMRNNAKEAGANGLAYLLNTIYTESNTHQNKYNKNLVMSKLKELNALQELCTISKNFHSKVMIKIASNAYKDTTHQNESIIIKLMNLCGENSDKYVKHAIEHIHLIMEYSDLFSYMESKYLNKTTKVQLLNKTIQEFNYDIQDDFTYNDALKLYRTIQSNAHLIKENNKNNTENLKNALINHIIEKNIQSYEKLADVVESVLKNKEFIIIESLINACENDESKEKLVNIILTKLPEINDKQQIAYLFNIIQKHILNFTSKTPNLHPKLLAIFVTQCTDPSEVMQNIKSENDIKEFLKYYDSRDQDNNHTIGQAIANNILELIKMEQDISKGTTYSSESIKEKSLSILSSVHNPYLKNTIIKILKNNGVNLEEKTIDKRVFDKIKKSKKCDLEKIPVSLYEIELMRSSYNGTLKRKIENDIQHTIYIPIKLNPLINEAKNVVTMLQNSEISNTIHAIKNNPKLIFIKNIPGIPGDMNLMDYILSENIEQKFIKEIVYNIMPEINLFVMSEIYKCSYMVKIAHKLTIEENGKDSTLLKFANDVINNAKINNEADAAELQTFFQIIQQHFGDSAAHLDAKITEKLKDYRDYKDQAMKFRETIANTHAPTAKNASTWNAIANECVTKCKSNSNRCVSEIILPIMNSFTDSANKRESSEIYDKLTKLTTSQYVVNAIRDFKDSQGNNVLGVMIKDLENKQNSEGIVQILNLLNIYDNKHNRGALTKEELTKLLTDKNHHNESALDNILSSKCPNISIITNISKKFNIDQQKIRIAIIKAAKSGGDINNIIKASELYNIDLSNLKDEKGNYILTNMLNHVKSAAQLKKLNKAIRVTDLDVNFVDKNGDSVLYKMVKEYVNEPKLLQEEGAFNILHAKLHILLINGASTNFSKNTSLDFIELIDKLQINDEQKEQLKRTTLHCVANKCLISINVHMYTLNIIKKICKLIKVLVQDLIIFLVQPFNKSPHIKISWKSFKKGCNPNNAELKIKMAQHAHPVIKDIKLEDGETIPLSYINAVKAEVADDYLLEKMSVQHTDRDIDFTITKDSSNGIIEFDIKKGGARIDLIVDVAVTNDDGTIKTMDTKASVIVEENGDITLQDKSGNNMDTNKVFKIMSMNPSLKDIRFSNGKSLANAVKDGKWKDTNLPINSEKALNSIGHQLQDALISFDDDSEIGSISNKHAIPKQFDKGELNQKQQYALEYRKFEYLANNIISKEKMITILEDTARYYENKKEHQTVSNALNTIKEKIDTDGVTQINKLSDADKQLLGSSLLSAQPKEYSDVLEKYESKLSDTFETLKQEAMKTNINDKNISETPANMP